MNVETSKVALSTIVSKRRLLRIKMKIKILKKELDVLNKNQVYDFEIATKLWFTSSLSACHKKISVTLTLTADILLLATKVENLLSQIKLNFTRIW